MISKPPGSVRSQGKKEKNVLRNRLGDNGNNNNNAIELLGNFWGFERRSRSRRWTAIIKQHHRSAILRNILRQNVHTSLSSLSRRRKTWVNDFVNVRNRGKNLVERRRKTKLGGRRRCFFCVLLCHYHALIAIRKFSDQMRKVILILSINIKAEAAAAVDCFCFFF